VSNYYKTSTYVIVIVFTCCLTKFKRYIARILLTIFSRWENKLWRYLYAKRETPRYDEFAKKIKNQSPSPDMFKKDD